MYRERLLNGLLDETKKDNNSADHTKEMETGKKRLSKALFGNFSMVGTLTPPLSSQPRAYSKASGRPI